MDDDLLLKLTKPWSIEFEDFLKHAKLPNKY